MGRSFASNLSFTKDGTYMAAALIFSLFTQFLSMSSISSGGPTLSKSAPHHPLNDSINTGGPTL